MTVEKITLLSEDEYKKHKDVISSLNGNPWWLRTPGYRSYCACGVYGNGSVSDIYSVHGANISVRPALLLTLDPSEPEFWCKQEKLVGSKVTYGNFTWTILEVKNSQIYVLCDKLIAEHRFDETSNEWETSELKAWLETEGLDIIERRVTK